MMIIMWRATMLTLIVLWVGFWALKLVEACATGAIKKAFKEKDVFEILLYPVVVVVVLLALVALLALSKRLSVICALLICVTLLIPIVWNIMAAIYYLVLYLIDEVKESIDNIKAAHSRWVCFLYVGTIKMAFN